MEDTEGSKDRFRVRGVFIDEVGYKEEKKDSCEHSNGTSKFIRTRAKNCVEGGEVSFWNNVGGGDKRICRQEVIRVAKKVGKVEDKSKEGADRHKEDKGVFVSKVGVEREFIGGDRKSERVTRAISMKKRKVRSN